MKNRSGLFVGSVALLALLQLLTILSSWVVSAVLPSLGIRSLLSNEGLRWLLSSFPQNATSEALVWILLISMALGMMQWSELPQKIITFKKCEYREKFAMRIFFLEIFLSVALCIVLAIFPHSLLLGATGHLVPDPFIEAVCVIFCTALMIGCMSFILFSGKAKNTEDAEKALVFGIKGFAPLIVIYFLLKELWEMMVFVLAN